MATLYAQHKKSNHNIIILLINLINLNIQGACQLNKTIPEDSVLPTNGGPIHLSSSKDILESFYKSDEKCALWIFPYHCIQFKSVLKAPGLQMLHDDYRNKLKKIMIRLRFEPWVK